MWAISTVPVLTASAACGVGTISPAGNTSIWKLPPVSSETWAAKPSAGPNSVSSERGKPEVMRHCSCGLCAIAGAARAAAAPPPTAAVRKLRLFMVSSQVQSRSSGGGSPKSGASWSSSGMGMSSSARSSAPGSRVGWSTIQ